MTVPFHVVVPARFASSRLPGKPLADLGGKPMIARVWENVRECGAASVVVATDDERIQNAAAAMGAQCLLTRRDHETGTDRLAEVADLQGWADDAIVVNVQGDEPLLPAELPARLAAALAADPEVGIATMAVPIRDPEELFSPDAVKVTLRADGDALYFSRAPIPWVRDAFRPGELPTALPEGVPFLRHLGLYAYRAGTLRTIARSPRGILEGAESLEQLRALADGVRIHVAVLDTAPPPGIDTPEDLARAQAYFSAR